MGQHSVSLSPCSALVCFYTQAAFLLLVTTCRFRVKSCSFGPLSGTIQNISSLTAGGLGNMPICLLVTVSMACPPRPPKPCSFSRRVRAQCQGGL